MYNQFLYIYMDDTSVESSLYDLLAKTLHEKYDIDRNELKTCIIETMEITMSVNQCRFENSEGKKCTTTVPSGQAMCGVHRRSKQTRVLRASNVRAQLIRAPACIFTPSKYNVGKYICEISGVCFILDSTRSEIVGVEEGNKVRSVFTAKERSILEQSNIHYKQ
jgi:hypothetical protein